MAAGGFLGMSGDQWSSLGQGASSFFQGMGAAQGYRSQAKWQSASAEVNTRLAKEARVKAGWEVTRQRLAKRKWIGGARAIFGWAGVEMEGSPMDMVAEADREMLLDEMMTTREGYIEQQMYLEEAKWNREAANRKAAKLSEIGGFISGGLGVLGSIFSDARLKEHIEPVPDALAKVRELAAYRYHYKGNDRACIGLLAQEVEKVLPQAVQQGQYGRMVNLYGLQALIVSALKELDQPKSTFGGFA